MYKGGNLTSIPELETEEESVKKWVPKKKHEVLKAKYKCLKKLFQIYDASVIGILPDQELETARSDDEARTDQNRRRKRSHRTKTDACAGTNETTSGDTNSEYERSSVATAVIREVTIDQSCISTQMDAKIDKFAETIDTFNERNFACNCQSSCQMHNCQCLGGCQRERLFKEGQMMENFHCQVPVLPCVGYERRKLTRFQCFVQRLFGMRKEAYKPEEQMYAASDPILTCKEKRRRRGLRLRRIKRAKKVRSDSALRDFKNPSILSYVQSVQKHCLMDTTPRKCPIVGCNMVSFGIINYNDHLNISHFKDRKFVCHYCHEGFQTEYEKLVHENEHIGISKMETNMSTLSNIGQTCKMATITQTEPANSIPEDKLKKIVSFFDKIADNEHIVTEIKKTRSFETNLTSKDGSSSDSASARSESEQTRTSSGCNLRRISENMLASTGSDISRRLVANASPYCCRYCGENFSCRRQLSLHVSSEHRAHDRFTKYHSCAGIVSPHTGILTEEGSINVRTASNSVSYGDSLKRVDTSTTIETVSLKKSADTISLKKSGETVSRGDSDASLSCDPSTNIVYTSVESLASRPSVVGSLMQKVRSYRWEPGTKIIRV